MKTLIQNRLFYLAVSSLFIITSSLSFTSVAYANTNSIESNDNLYIALNTGRPYHHMKRHTKKDSDTSISNTVVIRTIRGQHSRPYNHLVKKRTVERTEFAAFETKKEKSKKTFGRKISEGGKPRYMH